MMGINDLPVEILEMILLLLTPDSFKIATETSPIFRRTALTNKKLLRHQLHKLPGLRVQEKPCQALQRLFLSRDRRAAFNGIDVFADISLYKPLASTLKQDTPCSLGLASSQISPDELWTMPKTSAIKVCCETGFSKGLMVAAAHVDGSVHVYSIHGGRINPVSICDPRALDLEDDCEKKSLKYRCDALAWQRSPMQHLDHLVALFSYTVVNESE